MTRFMNINPMYNNDFDWTACVYGVRERGREAEEERARESAVQSSKLKWSIPYSKKSTPNQRLYLFRMRSKFALHCYPVGRLAR